MNFSKNDHMYYKQELIKLLNLAKKNNVIIKESNGIVSFIVENNNLEIPFHEQSSVNIKNFTTKNQKI